jgi:hypothetical protein
MFTVQRSTTRTRFNIRILKKRAKEFARFQRELQVLLRKHGVKMDTSKRRKTRKR